MVYFIQDTVNKFIRSLPHVDVATDRRSRHYKQVIRHRYHPTDAEVGGAVQTALESMFKDVYAVDIIED